MQQTRLGAAWRLLRLWHHAALALALRRDDLRHVSPTTRCGAGDDVGQCVVGSPGSVTRLQALAPGSLEHRSATTRCKPEHAVAFAFVHGSRGTV
jgi:hypothetical protein